MTIINPHADRLHYQPETDTKKADEPVTEYWRDKHHAFLRFRLLDCAGSVIQETKEWVVRAPLNNSVSAPISVQVELLHEDGCSQVIQTTAIKPY